MVSITILTVFALDNTTSLNIYIGRHLLLFLYLDLFYLYTDQYVYFNDLAAS